MPSSLGLGLECCAWGEGQSHPSGQLAELAVSLTGVKAGPRPGAQEMAAYHRVSMLVKATWGRGSPPAVLGEINP